MKSRANYVKHNRLTNSNAAALANNMRDSALTGDILIYFIKIKSWEFTKNKARVVFIKPDIQGGFQLVIEVNS